MVLQALKCGDEICDVLDSPIPSATQIVKDAESICVALHQDCVAHQGYEESQQRPGAPSNLLSLMSNISQELADYHPGSDVGPALHAARQVAYWSSVFISMVSSSASTTLSTHLSNPAVFSSPANNQPISSTLPPSSSVLNLSIPTSAFISSTSTQATSAT